MQLVFWSHETSKTYFWTIFRWVRWCSPVGSWSWPQILEVEVGWFGLGRIKRCGLSPDGYVFARQPLVIWTVGAWTNRLSKFSILTEHGNAGSINRCVSVPNPIFLFFLLPPNSAKSWEQCLDVLLDWSSDVDPNKLNSLSSCDEQQVS